MFPRTVATVCFTGVTSLQTLAAGDPVTEQDLFEDFSAVRSVTGLEQRIEQAPASVTIIDRDLIEVSGAQTFVDIFRLVPGFQAYYVSGNRYGIGYHDIGKESPNQVEVMVDGRLVYDALFASVSWGRLGIELRDIERIEVVRGSNAAAQGSNAFRNSINIITRKPVQDDGLELHTTVGDLDTRNIAIRYSDTLGALDYRLTLGYQHNEGFPAVEEGPMKDGRELAHGNIRATYTPTLIDTIDFAAGYTKDRVGWGDADHPDEFTLAKAYSHFESLRWQRSAGSDSDLSLHLYHTRSSTGNSSDLGPLYLWIDDELNPQDVAAWQAWAAASPAEAVAATRSLYPDETLRLNDSSVLSLINNLDTHLVGWLGSLSSERYDLKFQHNLRLSPNLRATWGLGARHENMNRYLPQSFDIDVSEHSFRLFGHAEWWPTDSLVINTGAMVEDTFVGTLISPRVAANYLFSDHQTLRLSYTRGHRAPSLLEAHERNISTVDDVVYNLFRIGDPDLGEEKVDTVDLGYLLQWPEHGLSLDVRLFYEHVRDVIEEQSIPAPPQYQTTDYNLKIITNYGFWQVSGAEMQLSYQLSPATLVRLHYMNVDLDRHAPPRLDKPGLDLASYARSKEDRMAQHSGGILLHHRFSPNWSVSLNSYYQSAVTWEDGNPVDSFLRTDAQISYQFQVGSSTGKLRLIGQNLDGEYSEFIDNNHFETRVFLVAEIHF